MDVNFTANMETLLDSVEDGSVKWKTIVRNFYPDLDAAVKEAEQKLPEYKIQDEVTDVICEECGRNMVIKYGPMAGSWPVRAFRNAETPSLIWRRSA